MSDLSEEQCTKCGGRPSIYFRPYSGERLCASCFKSSLRGRVGRTISRYDMFEFDSRIAIGVSGGKDSLSLLRILVEIEEKFPQSEIIALSIDEGVSGYRDEALELASGGCKSLGVEHSVHSFKKLFGVTMDSIASKPQVLSPCSFCGVLRRRALNDAAKAVGADRLVTAHNLDDMAQTALMNMLRGDLNRMSMMHPGGSELSGFVRRVKPYCEVPERESVLYAYLEGLDFQELPCPYSSEAMRNDVRSFLNRAEVKRPGTKFMAYRTALKLATRGKEARVMGVCSVCGEPTPGDVCRVCQLLDSLSES